MKHGGWFSVFLPLYDNGGRTIPATRFNQTEVELIGEFNGLTNFSEPTFVTKGSWKSRGIVYEDRHRIYAVFAEDINTARAYLSALKPKWKRRFRQEEILIVEMGVEVL